MKQLKIRFGRPDDTPEIIKWLTDNPQGKFDSGILNYPTLQIVTAYEDNGPNICHLPLQRVLMMETIARNPAASDLNVAQALRDLTKASEIVADSHDIREVYFLGGEGKVGDMAASPINHSFEKLNMNVYRMRLK